MPRYTYRVNALLNLGDSKDDPLAEVVGAVGAFTEPIKFRADKAGGYAFITVVFDSPEDSVTEVVREITSRLHGWGTDGEDLTSKPTPRTRTRNTGPL